MARAGIQMASGCNRLRSPWLCVVGGKGSRRAPARLRASSTSGLVHGLLARFRFKISLETRSRDRAAIHGSHNRGVVLITVVFVAALLAAIVMGMLQVHTEEIQVMRNHIRAAEALAIAEAGLNDALAQLRTDANWADGYVDKAFAGGTYTVTVKGSQITSLGTSAHGFAARVEAEVTVSSGAAPHIVEIDSVKVNE